MERTNRTPYPSPLQMLAILKARADGLSYGTIHRRTGYGRASIYRWNDAWGHDSATFEYWVMHHRVDVTGHTFSDYYPNFILPKNGAPREDRTKSINRFRTALGLK